MSLLALVFPLLLLLLVLNLSGLIRLLRLATLTTLFLLFLKGPLPLLFTLLASGCVLVVPLMLGLFICRLFVAYGMTLMIGTLNILSFLRSFTIFLLSTDFQDVTLSRQRLLIAAVLTRWSVIVHSVVIRLAGVNTRDLIILLLLMVVVMML